MISPERFRDFQASHRFSTIASAFLHVLMMGCLAIGYSQAIARWMPEWRSDHVLWIAMFTSMSAMVAVFTQRERTFKERIAFHLAEWLVITLMVQVVIYARRNFEGLLSDLERLEESLVHFFHPEFMLTIAPMALIWTLSLVMAYDLLRLEVDKSELLLENPEVLEKDRRQIRQAMSERVLFLGLLPIILAFVARLDFIQLFGDLPAVHAPVYNVVAYYLLALVLISQVQLSALRGHWLWSKTPIQANLAGAWLRYSLVFFVVLAAITIFLPTQYTMGFLETFGSFLDLAGRMLMFLIYLLLWPLVQLLTWLMSFVRRDGDAQPIDLEPPQMLPGDAGPAPGWWELLRSVLFWSLVIGICSYFMLYYLRQNRVVWDWLRSQPALRWLGDRIRAWWAWLRHMNRNLAAVIAAGRARLFLERGMVTPGRKTRRPFNVQRATARQKIIYFYLRLVERGKDEGLERQPSHTPHQYLQVLENNFPEVESELDGMTAAFMEARYTRHEIIDEQAGVVQTLWRRILQAFSGRQSHQ
jgi:hypothetical protein